MRCSKGPNYIKVVSCSLAGGHAFFFDDHDNGVELQGGQEGVKIVRQNFSPKLNNEVNERINSSLSASYVYLSMAFWFDRADVALPGFHKYFLEASHAARADAESMMKYINKRGGFIKLRKLKAPVGKWRTGLRAMEDALGMEKELNKLFLQTRESADTDPHLGHFLEDTFVDAKVDKIKELADHVTRLRSFRKDYGLGEFIVDKDLRD